MDHNLSEKTYQRPCDIKKDDTCLLDTGKWDRYNSMVFPALYQEVSGYNVLSYRT